MVVMVFGEIVPSAWEVSVIFLLMLKRLRQVYRRLWWWFVQASLKCGRGFCFQGGRVNHTRDASAHVYPPSLLLSVKPIWSILVPIELANRGHWSTTSFFTLKFYFLSDTRSRINSAPWRFQLNFGITIIRVQVLRMFDYFMNRCSQVLKICNGFYSFL